MRNRSILCTIRPAERDDAAILTALMHGASAYRGHYATILQGYEVRQAQLDEDVLYVAEVRGEILGFYSLTLGDEPELDLLFVADRAQGMGLGATLFHHMAEQARQHGIATVKIISHPPSLGFYERMGARRIGTKPPTAKAGWERPILVLST